MIAGDFSSVKSADEQEQELKGQERQRWCTIANECVEEHVRYKNCRA